ncbi:MAG: DUF3095 domain-containing protein [Micropepsaceae bacterium]
MQFPAFSDFATALDEGTYRAVPDDWLIAISDVIGSTPAIAAGRYKDVNLAGAATIAALQNACPGTSLPFAFGGDGATVLVPSELARQATGALAGMQKISRDVLGLQMRCALVPVSVVRKQGKEISVALHRLAGERTLAMICGGGIDAADDLVKSDEGSAYAILATASTPDADLTGLSCRWQPLEAQSGVILSLIVRARDSQSQLPRIYRELYGSIQDILRRQACPVSMDNLKSSFPPRGAAIERRLGNTRFVVYGQSALAKLSELTGLVIGGFDGTAYRKSLASHSDYRKFSDSLRMVLDCSEGEADGIEAILDASHTRNEIDFGTHRASAALMTCFVSTTDEGKHVHFVDGADGGYALAAQRLKAQIATKS